MRRPATRQALTSLFAAAAVAATGGCGTFGAKDWAPVNRVQIGGSDATPSDGYYADATAAILERDYGRALDLLQLARRGHERDARILNAFGVVYDKLGRFDLSARYYAQALAIEPASEIVQGNLAYSRTLQQTWRTQSADSAVIAVAQLPAAAPQPQAAIATPQLAMTAPTEAASAPLAASGVVERSLAHAATAGAAGLVRAAWPTATEPARPAASSAPAAPRAGSLVLLDASGQADRVRSLRLRLRQLGWSVGGTAPRLDAASQRTTIRYPERRARVAHALARTLPVPTRLEACGRACDVIEVTFGADVGRTQLAAAGLTFKGGR